MRFCQLAVTIILISRAASGAADAPLLAALLYAEGFWK